MEDPRPLNVLILGHADAFGTRLADHSQAWTQIILRELPERIGRGVQTEEREFIPRRSNNGAWAQALLEKYTPDIAIFATNPYGNPADTTARRALQPFRERFGSQYLGSDAGESLGRSVIGNTSRGGAKRDGWRSPEMEDGERFQKTIDGHLQVLQVLARDERLGVMVQGGNRLSRWLQREDPNLARRAQAVQELAQAFCREHRFEWFDTEAALLPGDRERSYLPDGGHRNAEAHRHFADLILPVLERMSRGAPEARGRRRQAGRDSNRSH